LKQTSKQDRDGDHRDGAGRGHPCPLNRNAAVKPVRLSLVLTRLRVQGSAHFPRCGDVAAGLAMQST